MRPPFTFAALPSGKILRDTFWWKEFCTAQSPVFICYSSGNWGCWIEDFLNCLKNLPFFNANQSSSLCFPIFHVTHATCSLNCSLMVAEMSMKCVNRAYTKHCSSMNQFEIGKEHISVKQELLQSCMVKVCQSQFPCNIHFQVYGSLTHVWNGVVEQI